MPASNTAVERNLLIAGFLLLLLGLLTGLGVGMMENPRMGLSSHMQGITNGLLLVGIGLVWPHLVLSQWKRSLLFWLSLFGTYANWLATLLAAAWGAGEKMMPLASAGHSGTHSQEVLISLLLASLTLAMPIVCLLALWGLIAAKRNP